LTAAVHGFVGILLLLVAVTVVAAAARRFGLPGPILLVLSGIAASFIPGLPSVRLDPQFVLVLVLPPLLYSAALSSSLVSIRRYRRAIGLLSVGYVLFSTVVVGVVASALLPGLPRDVAFVLGALVAPPDAVAASAVGRRVGLPRQILTILEGESLVNDATALTAFRVATAAVVSGGFSWAEAGARFLLASIGGVAVGLAVAFLVLAVRRRLDDPLVENALSLLTPFAAFLPAEAAGASGVLAVVVTGLLLGHHAPLTTGSASRLQAQAVWRMIDFILEGVVFALIGLQLRGILDALSRYSPAQLATYALVVVAAVIAGRFVWVFPATYLPRLLSAKIRAAEPSPPWQGVFVVSWAGMRGVVSLAAAYVVPRTTANGSPFPARDLLLFLTFAVIVATLVVQGATLPMLIRRLGLRPDLVKEKLSEAQAVHTATTAALDQLSQLVAREPGPLPAGVEDRLRETTQRRSLMAWERLGNDGRETPTAAYRRLRFAMLATEREVFVRFRNEGRIDDDVLRRLQRDLDFEESLLNRDHGD
jgi:monovalent cation/hydrogen antiporter